MKPIYWMGDTLNVLRCSPKGVKESVGFALYRAQEGKKHIDAKPLKGFSGAGVLEVVKAHHGDAYRAVYTVRFAKRVYVLHVFKKKSKRGGALPRRDSNLINERLKEAQAHYRTGATCTEPPVPV